MSACTSVNWLSCLALTKTVSTKGLSESTQVIESDFQISGIISHLVAGVFLGFISLSVFFALPAALCIVSDIMDILGYFHASDDEVTKLVQKYLTA